MSEKAQLRLLNSQVIILGLGTLGKICAQHLALFGIGKLVLVDSDIASVKTIKKELEALNDDIQIIAKTINFDAHNGEELIKGSHVVIDCLNDWQQKALASDICMHINIPLIHAGIDQFKFHVFTMIPKKSACLRCVFGSMGLEDLAHKKQNTSVFRPVLVMAGSYQASEAIKLIAKIGTTPGNHLISYDSLRHEVDESIQLGPQADCPDCR
jgi:adenylyltransferase/sulfurtransferase